MLYGAILKFELVKLSGMYPCRGATLCSGNFHPDAVLHRELSFKANKKAYYSEFQKYHNEYVILSTALMLLYQIVLTLAKNRGIFIKCNHLEWTDRCIVIIFSFFFCQYDREFTDVEGKMGKLQGSWNRNRAEDMEVDTNCMGCVLFLILLLIFAPDWFACFVLPRSSLVGLGVFF